jgi:polar amino acid transport system permease protein
MSEFFDWGVIRDSFPQVWEGFLINMKMWVVAGVIVLVWSLLVALARLVPGRGGLPLRILGTVYVDVFRGLPTILVFFLVGFGLPIAVPWFQRFSLFQLSVVALTLSYGGYVGEVYRAGIRSVHPSQAAAARSLGLSWWQTMRHVVIPQGIRRVIPPLLNDMVSLQKDTALASSIGVLEGLRQAFIYAGNHLSPAPLTGISLCFLLVTFPLARVADFLTDRDARKRASSH